MADSTTPFPDAAISALRAAGVSVAYLFGSRARGQARPDSDADLAVLLRNPKAELPLLAEAELATRLADVLQVDAVDVTLVERAPLEVRARVVREGRVVLEDDAVRRVRFEVDTQSRWFDVAPSHAEQTAAFLRRIAAHGLHG